MEYTTEHYPDLYQTLSRYIRDAREEVTQLFESCSDEKKRKRQTKNQKKKN